MDKVSEVLNEISRSIPAILKKNAVVMKMAYPDLRDAVVKALGDEDFPQEKKVGLKAMLDRGDFDKQVAVENKRVTRQIDTFVARKVQEAIKDGRLPKPKKDMTADDFINLIKKSNEKKSVS